jgi:hypothetical protein
MNPRPSLDSTQSREDAGSIPAASIPLNNSATCRPLALAATNAHCGHVRVAGIITTIVTAVALVLLISGGASASESGRSLSGSASQRQLLGVYSLVTRFPSFGTSRDPVVIDRYSSPGRITGHGRSVWDTVTGTVSGDRISMQFTTLGNVPARYHGTIHPDGSMSGNVQYGPPGVLGNGSWQMTRLPVTVQFGYTVVKSSQTISYGVELRNTSHTTTLRNVRVSIDGLSAIGKPVTSMSQGPIDGLSVGSVPPGVTVYLGHLSHHFNVGGLAHIVATPRIESTGAGGRPLPRVSQIRLDVPHRQVTAIVTNTTGKTMSTGAGWMATAVLYDRNGLIIGGGDIWFINGVNASTPLQPGRSTSLRVGIPPGVDVDRVAAARVSVTM